MIVCQTIKIISITYYVNATFFGSHVFNFNKWQKCQETKLLIFDHFPPLFTLRMNEYKTLQKVPYVPYKALL